MRSGHARLWCSHICRRGLTAHDLSTWESGYACCCPEHRQRNVIVSCPRAAQCAPPYISARFLLAALVRDRVYPEPRRLWVDRRRHSRRECCSVAEEAV